MKKLVFFFFGLLILWSCSPVQKTRSSANGSTVKSDSTEYEITIIDPDFDLWYQLQYSPAKDYTNEFYRIKNQIAVGNWNSYFTSGRYRRIVEDYIYYNNTLDYGMDVNRKLFWYFRYTEEKFRIRLLQ